MTRPVVRQDQPYRSFADRTSCRWKVIRDNVQRSGLTTALDIPRTLDDLAQLCERDNNVYGGCAL